VNRPSVFGWRSPWSGSEFDPIPWRYWLWYRLYRLVRVTRHRFGLHDWRERGPGILRPHEYCDWCGAIRATPPEDPTDDR
jgi:hypothetical protein